MSSGPRGSRIRRRAAYAVVIGVLLSSVSLVGCELVGGFLGPSASPTNISAPTQIPPTPKPTPVPPTATPTPPEVSQQEAQAVVHAWFDAVVAQDYQAAKDLTSGNGTTHTQELADGLQKSTEGSGVKVVLSKQRLDLTPGPMQPTGQSVESDFDIQMNANLGPIAVATQQIQGRATFIVQRVDGRTRITDMLDVTGLPTR